jgi:hypothetical protein
MVLARRLLQGPRRVKQTCSYADPTYPRRRIVNRRALCIFGLVAVLADGCGDEPSSTAPQRITEADRGRSFALALGSETSLRLSGRYEWSEPAVRGEAVRLTRVDYLQDPGFSEWMVLAVQPGTATIAARGTPAGTSGNAPLRFDVEIRVAR